MPRDLLTEVSIVGGILILVSGVSMLRIKDCKTLNMLPALFVSVMGPAYSWPFSSVGSEPSVV